MTLSTSLPSAAAQKGYDIIDAETMRLIERVPAALTEQELLEQAAQQKVEEEARLQAEAQAKQAEEAHGERERMSRQLTDIQAELAELTRLVQSSKK